jgi:acyl-CoA reductase-like NAD-dependent aldehyde dehydrogenase
MSIRENVASQTDDLPEIPTKLLIGSEWRDASDGGTFETMAPAFGKVLADVAAATPQDVDAAVAAARKQVDGGAWSQMTGSDRGRLINRLAELIERDLETFAILEALDVGKPAFEPRLVDIPHMIDVFRHFAGWADKIEGRWVSPQPLFGRTRQAYTIREPLGVIGVITPWNAPSLIASWKLAPALASGNTVVLKPAEDACLTSLYLGKLIQEAGFPDGVVNILPGLGPVAGAALAHHSGIDKVSFTGGPDVGREIARQAAGDFRRFALELGGKSPQIICGDVDIEAVIPNVAMTFFANQGEVCAAGTRILVASEHYDAAVEGLAQAASSITVGNPFDEATKMGALINERQQQRVKSYIDRGKAEGSELVAGGELPDLDGYFVQPTVFAGPDNSVTIAQEEIFGPVGLVLAFNDLDEALATANDTTYGLAAYVWTQNLNTAHEVAAKVKAGSVWVNGSAPPDARLPWGGFKQSGVGRELGWAGIEASTEEKTVTITF